MVAPMKTVIGSRTLHNWIGIVLVVPLFIVGMSTFFMSHEKSLGNFVIAYTNDPLELKDILHTPDGRLLLATKNGVYERHGDTWAVIDSLQGQDVRSLEILAGGQVLAAGKQGLWVEVDGGSWQQRHDADIQGLQVYLNNWYLVTKEQSILISHDQGGSWQPAASLTNSLSALNVKRPLQLNKFMHDLHTGKALLGKHYEWIWADLLALVLVLLSLTGVYMWWKSQKRKLTLQHTPE